MLPEASSLFLMGLLYGTTVCSLSCLSYVGPYLMGCGNGFGDGLLHSFVFMLGKVATYTVLGAIAGGLGQVWELDQGVFSTVAGLVTVVVGLSLLFGNRKGGCSCKGKYSSLLLGVSSSLMPCPPLAAVFMVAAQTGSVYGGGLCGVVYGLGLVLSPLLLIGGSISLISKRIREEAAGFVPYLRGTAALVLVSAGIRLLLL